MLTDFERPERILRRTRAPIMRPVESFETEGFMPNVLFPTGVVEHEGTLYIYYGGGDEVLGVAGLDKAELLERLHAEGQEPPTADAA